MSSGTSFCAHMGSCNHRANARVHMCVYCYVAFHFECTYFCLMCLLSTGMCLLDSSVFLVKGLDYAPGGSWCTLCIGWSKKKLETGVDNKPVLILFPSAAPQPTANWQYQALSRNSADVTTALAAIKLAGILAGHLKARGIIGQHVFEQATNYAPDVTEYARVQHLITAVLNKTKYNPQWYHDFIKVLELDGLHPDTEAARSLLPAGIIMT